MTKPTKHLILAGGVFLVLLFSLLLPAKLTYAADLFYEMISSPTSSIASSRGSIEILEDTNSDDVVSETSQQLAKKRTNLQISPNSAVVNAGSIPVVIKNSKPFNNAVSPTVKMNGTDLQYVIQGDANTIYAVLDPQDFGPGTHDLTVNDGNGDTLLADAFTVTGYVEPKPYLAMVYMACDNNLASSCIRLFNNLEFAVHNNPNMRIAVFWDGNKEGDSAHYLIQPDDSDAPDSNPSLGIAMESYNQSNSLALGEADSADVSTLVQFAAWAKSQYPDTYSFLSLVDHGAGWAPDLYPGQPAGYKLGSVNSSVGGLFWDDTSGNVMPTKKLADALDWITQGNGNQFDLIYIDACQMGAVEVMAELGPYAEYIITHENFAWATYPYDRFFEGVNSDTLPDDLARQIAEVYRDSLPDDGHPAQMSVIETSQIDDLLGELETFSNALRSTPSSAWSGKRADIQQAVLDSAHVDENVDFKLNDQDSSIDLHHFASQFIDHPRAPASVENAAQDLMDAIEAAIERNYTYSSRPWPGSDYWDMSNFNGLSIYFPLADEWKRAFYGPSALPNFAANSSWDELIQEWHTTPIIDPPTDQCDPQDCIPSPMHIALTIDEAITDTGGLVWVPVSLHGVEKADDIRGVQISVNVEDTSILVPDSGLRPRSGNLFPTDAYSYSVTTTEGWDILITDVGSVETISGTDQVVQLPFRFLVDGCQDLEFTTHIVRDSVPNKINHYYEQKGVDTRVCSTDIVGTLHQLAKGYKRPPGQHGGTEIKISGPMISETQSGSNGEYEFGPIPNGSYTVSFDNNNEHYLYYETAVNVNGRTQFDVTLCTGDMDHDNDIDTFDRFRLSLGTIPVDFPTYDLNEDGYTDVGDSIILQQNLGKVSPNAHCGLTQSSRSSEMIGSMANSMLPVTRGFDMANQRANRTPAPLRQAQSPVAKVNSAQNNPHAAQTFTLRATDMNAGESFNGIGTRIGLPVDASVTQVKLLGQFAGGVLDQEQIGDKLYIIATFPQDAPLTADAEIARIEMSLCGDLVIEGANPQELSNRLQLDADSECSTGSQLYLPLLQR